VCDNGTIASALAQDPFDLEHPLSATMAIPTHKTVPYPPSWIDRLMRVVQRLPIPYWLTYLLLATTEGLLIHAAAWLDGTTPLWTVQRLFLLFPFRTWLALACMTCLNQQALQALHRFRPLLGSDEEEQGLAQQMTTMPARPVWITSLLGMLYFLFLALFRPIDFIIDRPLLEPAFLISGLGAFGIGSVIYYHTFHQLRLVHRIYAGVLSFNLFRLEPIYIFSGLTSRTSFVYLFLASITLFLFPYPLTDLRALLSYLLQILLSVLAFALPLWNTHQRLVTEKRRLESETALRMEATLQQMHRHLDDADAQAIAGDKTVLESLMLERKLLEAIPTWPWQPSTLRGLLTAFFLPLILFVGQLVIERWFTP
jgi:hypothetical protein